MPSQAEPRPPAEGPSACNIEDIIRKVMSEETAFTRACIAGIEDRLLPEKSYRLPLAADKRNGEPVPTSQEEDALLPFNTSTNQQGWTKVVGRGKGKGKKTAAVVPAVPAITPSSQSQSTGKGKGKSFPSAGKRNLVPPKTAAVVVTLTAEAAERGETYASVIMRARTYADPQFCWGSNIRVLGG